MKAEVHSCWYADTQHDHCIVIISKSHWMLFRSQNNEIISVGTSCLFALLVSDSVILHFNERANVNGAKNCRSQYCNHFRPRVLGDNGKYFLQWYLHKRGQFPFLSKDGLAIYIKYGFSNALQSQTSCRIFSAWWKYNKISSYDTVPIVTIK